MSRPGVAVVVPTRSRPQRLQECLAALRHQDVHVELVVADDGPSGDRRTVEVARAFGAFVVRTGGRGPAAARNAGLAASAATVVCFTDDDCRPAPQWARRLAGALAGGAGAVFGDTFAARHNAFDVASQAITSCISGGTRPFAPSCNLAMTREVGRMHPFDERFREAAGEDREWCERAAAAGVRIVHVRGAPVLHDQRLTGRRFVAQQIRYGRAATNRAPRPARFYAGLVRAGFRAGFAPGLLVCASQAAVAAGAASETLRERRAAAR